MSLNQSFISDFSEYYRWSQRTKIKYKLHYGWCTGRRFTAATRHNTSCSEVKYKIRKPFRMLVLVKFSERMMTIYTDELKSHQHKWAAPSEFGTYRLCEQRRFRRACASAQSRQNLRCSLIQAVSQEEPSDRKPDPWPFWMAGHAQLKFVMTECSKTQIRLARPKWSETLKDRFYVYVNVIHNIRTEYDENFIFPAVVSCSSI